MNERCNIWHVSEQSLRKKDSSALEASNGSRLLSEQSQKFKYGKAKSPEVCFPKLHVQCIEELIKNLFTMVFFFQNCYWISSGAIYSDLYRNIKH